MAGGVAADPAYVLTGSRVGYRMPQGEAEEREEWASLGAARGLALEPRSDRVRMVSGGRRGIATSGRRRAARARFSIGICARAGYLRWYSDGVRLE